MMSRRNRRSSSTFGDVLGSLALNQVEEEVRPHKVTTKSKNSRWQRQQSAEEESVDESSSDSSSGSEEESSQHESSDDDVSGSSASSSCLTEHSDLEDAVSDDEPVVDDVEELSEDEHIEEEEAYDPEDDDATEDEELSEDDLDELEDSFRKMAIKKAKAAKSPDTITSTTTEHLGDDDEATEDEEGEEEDVVMAEVVVEPEVANDHEEPSLQQQAESGASSIGSPGVIVYLSEDEKLSASASSGSRSSSSSSSSSRRTSTRSQLQEPGGTSLTSIAESSIPATILITASTQTDVNHDVLDQSQITTQSDIRSPQSASRIPREPSPTPTMSRSSSWNSRSDGSIVKPGKWKLGTKIGAGAFGVVYVGMNSLTGTLMAVKTIEIDNDVVLTDVRREIDLLKSLEHPNIVRYLGAETLGAAKLHIFQEWVPGGSVTQMLRKFGPFSLPVVQSYVAQVLRGLTYLHENGIVHRDIKGSNLLVNNEGVVKLADFGASKKLSEVVDDMKHSMRGTPYFMAPEVFEEHYNSKADIWSIGCVLLQMTSGRPPFKELGFSNPVALYKHIKALETPPFLAGEARTPSKSRAQLQSLEQVIGLCMSQDPEARPTAHELLAHPFFAETESILPEDKGAVQSSSLFSPPMEESKNELTQTTPLHRSNSASDVASALFSPPVPEKRSPLPPRSPAPFSPPPDTRHWPQWAKAHVASTEKTPRLSVDSMVYSTSSVSTGLVGLDLLHESTQ